MLAVNPYQTHRLQQRLSANQLQGTADYDVTEETSSMTQEEHTSLVAYLDEDQTADDKPLLAGNSSYDEDEAPPVRRSLLQRRGSDRSQRSARSKSRERPQRRKSGQGSLLVRSTSNKDTTAAARGDESGNNGGGGEGKQGLRLGLLRSMSFSDRSARRNARKSAANNDADEDSGPKRPGLSNSLSCRDLYSSRRSGLLGASSEPNEDDSSVQTASQIEHKENLEKIKHLEAKTELYKEEFKRVVQEKKQLLSSFVVQTTGLNEELTMARKKLYAAQEENRKLKAALDEAGVQMSTLAALTESDGLPNMSFALKSAPTNPRAAGSLAVVQGSSDDDEGQQIARSTSVDYRCHIVKGPGMLLTQVHRPRPSLFQLPGLRTLPFWTQQSGVQTEVAYEDPTLTAVVRHFEKNWEKIAKEYKKTAPTTPADTLSKDAGDGGGMDPEMLKGKCSVRSYMKNGKLKGQFEEKFARTTAVIQVVREQGHLFEVVPFGSAYFINLKPKSRMVPKASQMNLRLRLHLPIVFFETNKSTNGNCSTTENSTSTTPSKKGSKAISSSAENDNSSTSDNQSQGDNNSQATTTPSCGIRVGPLQRKYELGKVLLMDDSYDHECWNDTDNDKVILVVDVWHPDVTPQERTAIAAHSNMNNNSNKQESGVWSVRD